MNREEKKNIIDSLVLKLNKFPHYYLADTSGLPAVKVAELRRKCYESDVTMVVVKNTLLQKALEQIGKDNAEIIGVLKGSTTLMFTEVSKAPAVLIKEFRKDAAKPALKAAFVEESVYLGDGALEDLVNIKSKNELIGEIIGLLQSPAKNVISALQANAGQKIAGLLKTLEERN